MRRVRRAALAALRPCPYPHTLSAAALGSQPPPIQVFLMSLNTSDKVFFFYGKGCKDNSKAPCASSLLPVSPLPCPQRGGAQWHLHAHAPRHNPGPPRHKHTRVRTGPRGLHGCHRTGVTPVTSVPHPCLLHAAPRTPQDIRGGGCRPPTPSPPRPAVPVPSWGWGASPRGTVPAWGPLPVPAPPPPCCCCVSAPRPGEARRGRRGRAGQRRGRI